MGDKRWKRYSSVFFIGLVKRLILSCLKGLCEKYAISKSALMPPSLRTISIAGREAFLFAWSTSLPRVSHRALHRRYGLRELLRVHTRDGEVPVPEAS